MGRHINRGRHWDKNSCRDKDRHMRTGRHRDRGRHRDNECMAKGRLQDRNTCRDKGRHRAQGDGCRGTGRGVTGVPSGRSASERIMGPASSFLWDPTRQWQSSFVSFHITSGGSVHGGKRL